MKVSDERMWRKCGNIVQTQLPLQQYITLLLACIELHSHQHTDFEMFGLMTKIDRKYQSHIEMDVHDYS